MPEALNPNRYKGLDGLRAVSILLVLLPHFGLNHYLHLYGILLDSTLGVHTFFIISGFLITTLLLKEQIAYGRISIRSFYVRRALRILPLIWLYLLVLFVLNYTFKLNMGMMDFISSALFLKNMPMRNEPFTAHFWSLAVEGQFYLAFPAILSWSPKKYQLIALFFAFIIPGLAIVNQLCNTQAIPWVYWIFKISSYLFWKGPVMIMLGSVLSLLLFKQIVRPQLVKSNSVMGLLAIILAIVISSKTLHWYNRYLSTYIAALLITVALAFVMSGRDLLTKILTTRLMIRIGILSYSIYIWQELFIGIHPWQPWLHFLVGWPIWQIIIVKLLLMCAIAPLSFLFESVFLKLKTRF